MSIATLQKECSETKNKLSAVQESKSASDKRIGELQAQHGSLVVAARTGDAPAKQTLTEIDAEIKILQRESSDDAAAIAQISSALGELQALLASEQHEAKRQQMRKEIQAHINDTHFGQKRMVALIEELKEVFTANADRSLVIAARLRDLDGKFDGVANRMYPYCSMLKQFLVQNSPSFDLIEGQAMAVFTSALNIFGATDSDADKQKTPDHAFFEASTNIRHDLVQYGKGDRLWLTQEEAAGLLKSGAIKTIETSL